MRKSRSRSRSQVLSAEDLVLVHEVHRLALQAADLRADRAKAVAAVAELVDAIRAKAGRQSGVPRTTAFRATARQGVPRTPCQDWLGMAATSVPNEEVTVTTDNASVGFLRGTYTTFRRHHGRLAYRKITQACQDVFIYYWDARDGPSWCGWWFGWTVGGRMVLAYNSASPDDYPPERGWRVPFNGGVDETFVVLDDDRTPVLNPPADAIADTIPDTIPTPLPEPGSDQEDEAVSAAAAVSSGSGSISSGGRGAADEQDAGASSPRKDWQCSCGFRNRERNTVCGGKNGALGCKRPAVPRSPKASLKPGIVSTAAKPAAAKPKPVGPLGVPKLMVAMAPGQCGGPAASSAPAAFATAWRQMAKHIAQPVAPGVYRLAQERPAATPTPAPATGGYGGMGGGRGGMPRGMPGGMGGMRGM
eukprot:TRINITY_DN13976_c0_g1_i1.p2 TRINITY_DN13976_c0_g1~~TRINITY_DN13976_c0_g1_i1.p2  ORF type:complete len:418 (-),score=61.90 TRINITY_DN13976_c0_g1_i1:93-1346(-)